MWVLIFLYAERRVDDFRQDPLTLAGRRRL